MKCPKCGSTNINQYRMMAGPIWCASCGFRVAQKEKNNPFVSNNQHEYQKYEFCQADACPFVEITGGCPVKPENCYRTAKQLHHWLIENGYRIVRDK
jgi:DNA-directed RNA polymerase subunit RPC12/RpoP